MYRLSYSALLLLASIISSQARHTVFISHNAEHTYLPSSSEPGVCMKRQCVIAASNILTSLDETVDPCDDFYQFACGGWLKRQEVSEDKPHIYVILEMQDNLNRKLKDLLESEYKSSDPPFVKKLKDFYNTCMDLDSIEKRGSEPLKEMLIRLGGWPVVEGDKWDETKFDWVDSVISLRKHGYEYNRLIHMSLYAKNQNDTTNVIHLYEPSSSLPWSSNITIGLSDDKISKYFKKMVKAAKMLGADESTVEKELEEVMHFLIAVKKIKDEADSEEAEIRYLSVKELEEEVPQVPWLKYFNGLLNSVVYENDTVTVFNIDSIRKAANLIISTEKRVIANYLMYCAVLDSTEFLSEEWRNLDKDESEEKETPRWQTCLSYLMAEMENAISSYYIRHYFNAESKDEAIILLKYIHKELLKMLEENDWMDEKTREKAEEKANALKFYIGYPEELLDDTFMMKMYENLTISTDSHLSNIMTLKKVLEDEKLSKFRTKKKLTRDIKFASIAQVKAFYDYYSNSIGIPAGILHDAFFEKDRPNYMNFGAIGCVIGHEITHGFDNKGRHFDKNGNRANWWDKESDEHFRKKVQCIIDQYDNYTTDIGMKVNGEQTQNENIADNGGLKEAYWAYQAWAKDNGIEPLLPALNYTQNQLFWLSAALVWCSKRDPINLKEKLLMGNHSPGRYRTIGPMSNLEEFSKDFKCSADSPMNRKYKCKVW